MQATDQSEYAKAMELERAQVIDSYRRKLMEHRESEANLKQMRLGIRDLETQHEKSENDIKALQSVGQIIGEVLKQLDSERCN